MNDGDRTPVLEALDLCRGYPVRQRWLRRPLPLHALRELSLQLDAGRTLAVVGESGCGKSTLARLLALVERPSQGVVRVDGAAVTLDDRAAMRRARLRVQMVFQNPYASLNPRQRIDTMLDEPLKLNTDLTPVQRRARVLDMLDKVGLVPEHAARYPHMLSGGQRQRVAIARALMLHPGVLIADEPVSALDISVQAQVLNLMLDLQRAFGLAYLFITHNIGVVRHLADRVIVMYLGRAVETADAEALLAKPQHPYTRALLASTPQLVPGASRSEAPAVGEQPSALQAPPGCPFHPRCPHQIERCRVERPLLRSLRGGEVACHRAEEI